MIRTNTPLTTIAIHYSNLGDNGLLPIATALACHNLTLLQLIFDTARDSGRGQQLLPPALKRNQLLVQLASQLRHMVPLTLVAPTWRTNNQRSNQDPSHSILGTLPAELIRHIMTFLDPREHVTNYRELLRMVMGDTITQFGPLTAEIGN